MSRWLKIVLANVLVLILVVGGFGFLALYLYDKSNYITTDDARISANTINILAMTPGKITAWNVKPGDRVSSNSTVGSQQTVAPALTETAGSKPVISTKTAQNNTTGTAGSGGTSGTTGTPGRSAAPGTTGSSEAASPPATPGGTPAPSGGTNPQVSTAPPAAGAPGGTPAAAAKLDIKAPITGTIIQNIAEPGQTVAAGQPLAMMADLSKVFVVANIEETRIRDVKPGQSVDVTLDAFPGDTFSGKVLSVTRATASTFSMLPTGTTSGSYTKVVQKIPVQISIDTTGKEILPGMSASVRIEK